MLVSSEINRIIEQIESGDLVITDALNDIASAQYGEDVRAAIYTAIYTCYKDGKAGAIDIVARAQLAEAIAGLTSDSEVIDVRTAANGTVFSTAGEAVRAQIEQLLPQTANLWADNVITDGSFVNSQNGSIVANAAMCLGPLVPVYPGAEYSYPNTYVQGAFYDSDSTYISGFSCNFEYNQTYPSTLWQTVTAPENAAFVRLSTRLGNKDNFSFTQAAQPNTTGGVSTADTVVAKGRVIEERNDVVYDVCFTGSNNSEISVNGFSYADGYMNSSTSGALLRYAKYTTLDRSRISAIFKTDAAAKFRFGYTTGSAYGVSTVSDGAFCVQVDTAARTMTAYIWNGSSDDTLVQAGESVSFDFEIANGLEHYIEIEKRTVNEVGIRLYCSECPGSVAEMTLQAQESAGNENLFTGYMRCWGGGTFQLTGGSVSVRRMSMYSTGNQYAHTMVIGDSFVEHAGRNPLCGYAQRMYDATGGNVFIDGRGGATAADTLKRIIVSLGCCHPRYVVLNVGTNDSAGSNTEAFIENLQALIRIAETKRCVPVLVTVPPRSDIDNSTFARTANDWVRSSGYRYIDLAKVLSTGDGTTQDSSKYIADGIHPNIAGGAAIFRYIEANLPEISKGGNCK